MGMNIYHIIKDSDGLKERLCPQWPLVVLHTHAHTRVLTVFVGTLGCK